MCYLFVILCTTILKENAFDFVHVFYDSVKTQKYLKNVTLRIVGNIIKQKILNTMLQKRKNTLKMLHFEL